MSRRRVIQAAGAFGFGAASLGFMDQETVAASMTGDRVKYVAFIRFDDDAKGGRRPVYKTMPREEWVRRKSAVKLMERVQAQLDGHFDDPYLTAAFQPNADSHTDFGVTVEWERVKDGDGNIKEPEPSIEEVREFLPEHGTVTVGKGGNSETVENIPIEVTKVANKESCRDSDCQDISNNYSSLPGGAPIASDDGSTSGLPGTICAQWDHCTYGSGWVTAGHVVEEDGRDVWYPQKDTASATILGPSRDYIHSSCYVDFAFIEDNNSDVSPTPKIAVDDHTGGTDNDVIGYVSDSQLESHVGGSTEYATQGRRTCRIYNVLTGTTTDGWQSEHDTSAGDSGGPLFLETADGAYIAGHVTIARGDQFEDGDLCFDDTGGMKASSLDSKLCGGYGTV